MNTGEKYYLTSGDSKIFEPLREFHVIKEIFSSSNNSIFWLVKIRPPVIGQNFNMGELDINYLLLASRAAQNELNDIKSFPVWVYILLPKKDLLDVDYVSKDDFINIAWGEIIKDPADWSSWSN